MDKQAATTKSFTTEDTENTELLKDQTKLILCVPCVVRGE